eukprot:365440-Rhodomonas_salina.4
MGLEGGAKGDATRGVAVAVVRDEEVVAGAEEHERVGVAAHRLLLHEHLAHLGGAQLGEAALREREEEGAVRGQEHVVAHPRHVREPAEDAPRCVFDQRHDVGVRDVAADLAAPSKFCVSDVILILRAACSTSLRDSAGFAKCSGGSAQPEAVLARV